MACPICDKRKGRRFCPAKAASICTICCGTGREVTIDCPSGCPYLVESRRRDWERREIDWSKIPFGGTRIPASFVASHEKLILALSYAVCVAARDNPGLVDDDAREALRSLAEAYQTLSSGLYYEKPPDYLLQRDLYTALKAAIEDFKKMQARQPDLAAVRDGEIRDALIFLTHLAATRSNGRPKGRACLDLLRSQFKPEEFQKQNARLVVTP